MSTALNTDGHDGPPSEAVAVLGTDGLPQGPVPDLTVKTLGVPKIASPMAPLLESRQTRRPAPRSSPAGGSARASTT